MHATLRQIGRFGLALTGLCLSACGSGGGGGGATTPTPTPAPTPSAFQALNHQPPVSGFLAMLMTDGTVVMQSNADAGIFYKLTPDSNGSYASGTWSQISSPPSGYAPYAGAEAVLADGRLLLVGGEYNQNVYQLPFAPSGLTNMSAIYDPVTDRWAMIPAPAGVPYIGDPPSVVLPDGRFVFGTKLDNKMFVLNPANLTWTAYPASGKNDNFAEEGFTLMPDGSIFTIDVGAPPKAEHFVPSLGAWVRDGDVPVTLTSPTDYPGGLTYGPAPLQVVDGVSYGPGPTGTYLPPGEIGPALLRPDGTVFATGAAKTGVIAHTAIYHPPSTPSGAGTWTTGPDFPAGDNADDVSAALLSSGNVLVAGTSGALYEFNGTALNQVGLLPTNNGKISYFLLPLPNGQVLITGGTTMIYTPSGSPQAGWAPTITSAPATVTRGQTYSVSGTQFNGLSEGAAYGDEFKSATNYPLVRITNTATGHVIYARTHNHSTMAVATGATPVSTQFDVPAGTEAGASSLVVIANGIASNGVTLTVN